MVARRTRATGNPELDTKNPVFKEAEQVAAAFLRRRYGYNGVVDNRKSNQYWDFGVFLGTDQLQKLDVKADQVFVSSGAVAWENRLEMADGSQRDGWGRKDLDFIFYVDPATYTGLLIRAPRMQRLAMTLHGKVKEFRMGNPGYATAVGLAIPVKLLREVGAVAWEGYLDGPQRVPETQEGE